MNAWHVASPLTCCDGSLRDSADTCRFTSIHLHADCIPFDD